MSRISDEQKYDPFYKKRKNELHISDDDMVLYASTNILDFSDAPHYEKLLRRLYHSRWLTSGKKFELREVIKLIMVKIPYTTIEFFNRLNLFDTYKNAGAYISKNLLSEKKENGFVRAFPTYANCCRKVYTLTNAAKQETLATLPKEIHKQLSPSKSLSAASNVHDAFCCNLYYYLLTDFKFVEFDWCFVPYFNLRETFSDSLAELANLKTSFQENTDALRPDAFIRTFEEDASYYFVEQDMNTERAGRLAEKFQKYDILFSTMETEQLNNTSILFSVFADTRPKNQIPKNNENDVESAPSKLRKQLKEFAFYICISERGMEQTVTDMENDLIQKRDANGNPYYASAIKNQINGMLQLIDTFHKVHLSEEEDTIENLFSYIEKQIELQKDVTVQSDNLYTNRIISSRKDTLRKIIDASPSFQVHLRKGVKFVVTDTFHPEELHNVLLVDHDDDVLGDVLLPRLQEFFGIDSDSYYSPILYMGDDVYLCNQCEFENYPNLLIAVENISADLGAWYRLKNFIERAEIFPQKEKNVCILVLASTMDDIKHFNENVCEYGTVSERYCNEDDAKKPKNNIHILYSCYEKQEDITNFFVLNKEGEMESI